MEVGREGLAFGAEISVVAHRALVANTGDVSRSRQRLAKGTIAEDAEMNLVGLRWLGNRLV